MVHRLADRSQRVAKFVKWIDCDESSDANCSNLISRGLVNLPNIYGSDSPVRISQLSATGPALAMLLRVLAPSAVYRWRHALALWRKFQEPRARICGIRDDFGGNSGRIVKEFAATRCPKRACASAVIVQMLTEALNPRGLSAICPISDACPTDAYWTWQDFRNCCATLCAHLGRHFKLSRLRTTCTRFGCHIGTEASTLIKSL